MRCERCKFENIPGQKTCVKCGSTLEIKHATGDIYPPRMSRWKKPFRNISRWMRLGKMVPEQNIKALFPPRIKKPFNNNIWWLFLSIVPGLGHLVQGRFKQIRWYFLAWSILILLGLFFYGGLTGFILLGLAIGIHTRIALQSGIIKDLSNLREKIVTGIFVLIVLALIYRFTPQVVVPNIVGGYAGLTIPYHNVETGDYLLGWRNLGHTALLRRGSLVLIYPALFNTHHGVARASDAVFAEIVGIAGEQLQIANDTFIINGQKLDMGKYPVPQWLRNTNISVIIPDNNYFLNVLYNVHAQGVRLDGSDILRMCLVKPSDIEAKAFLCWWPLSRRGFIKVD
jgi:hypothetical protein